MNRLVCSGKTDWSDWYLWEVRCTCRVSTVSFRAQAQRSLEGVCFALRMWVIHKIRLHTHVGRLVVPVRPMAHHRGVGFVVNVDIEPFIARSVGPHRSIHPRTNQSNATVLQSKREINPVLIWLAQDSLRTYRTLDFPIAVFTKLLIAFVRKFLVNNYLQWRNSSKRRS